ncbi:MAG: hypothetical protein J7L54_01040 [Elusimicrobia bacterium]|nr:hypothetical protein [Elusimicrobiota bacterium]
MAVVFFVVVFFLTVKKGLDFFSVLFLALLFFFVGNPAIRKTSPLEKKILCVLLDTSLSMAEPVGQGKISRMEEAKRLLRDNLAQLKKRYRLKFYSFGADIKALSEREFFAVSAAAAATDIRKAVNEVSRISPPGAEILLFSDGRQNLPTRLNVSKPVFSVGMGEPSGTDVSVEIVSFPQNAFEGISQTAKIKVRKDGNVPSVKLRLFQGAKKLCEKEVDFAPHQSEKEIDLDFVPVGHGKNMRFSVDVLPLDSEPDNNTAVFRMPVFKSRIKALFISGRPGWEYRYIRAFIKSNPRIDLTSFVILRNPEDYIPFPDNKLSLIPFPVRKIFLKDIYGYDLVILLNFDYRRFMPESYLKPLAEHIRKGGGFMLIGGENVFKGGNYIKSPLGKILPVVVGAGNVFEEKNFFLKVFPDHPITSFISEIKGVADVNLNGLNRVSRLREGARTLLGTKSGLPVAVAGSAGRGRVIVILTNDLWRIFFGKVELGYFYQEFFRNSVMWLTKSPLLDEISVMGKKKYLVGEKMELSVSVKPKTKGRLSAKIYTPSGEQFLSAQLRKRNLYIVEKNLETPGKHRVVLELKEKGRTRARYGFEFSVGKKDIEISDTRSDFSTIESISGVSGGKFVSWRSFGGEFLKSENKARFYHPARTPFFVFLLVIVAGLKWWRQNLR